MHFNTQNYSIDLNDICYFKSALYCFIIQHFMTWSWIEMCVNYTVLLLTGYDVFVAATVNAAVVSFNVPKL
jgi:hypothetical protein